jgi:adenylate cyclase class IV
MIEVEIRGELGKEKFEELNNFFSANSKLLETQDREMILLRDTPGYHEDPTLRERDIRIRRTNGKTEIMVKEMKSVGNVARSEHSFQLGEMGLEEAKQFVKYFGSKMGQWMHRRKKVYEYGGVYWSVVEAVPGIFYYEAEKEVSDDSEIEAANKSLRDEAMRLGLPIFTTEEYKEFIKMLGAKVNKYIEW